MIILYGRDTGHIYYGGVAWPPLERRLTLAIVVPVPTICVFSWLMGSIQRHRLVREAVNRRETKAGWPRSRQEFAYVFFLCLSVFTVGITAAVARPQLSGLEHRRHRQSRILSGLVHRRHRRTRLLSVPEHAYHCF